MVLSLTHDSGLHKFRVETDKQGHNPSVACWCGKSHRLEFTWGVKRFAKGLNDFLLEHENCLPLQEQQAERSA